MSDASTISTLNPELQRLSEQILNRSLTDEEKQKLLQFQQQLTQKDKPELKRQSEYLQQQAMQNIEKSQKDVEANMSNILREAQIRTEEILQKQQDEEQAIIDLVEHSNSLSELRPSSLNAQNSISSSSNLAIAQIADRLAVLAKKEVEDCFNRYFSTLADELRRAINSLQQAESRINQNNAPNNNQ